MSHAHVVELTPGGGLTPEADDSGHRGGSLGFALIATAVPSTAVFLVAAGGLPPWAMCVG